MPARFVILHHQLAESEHWDLMLEYGDELLTWQLPRVPTGPDSFPMTAVRIANHRKAYLTYEGPIDDNRGTVKQVDCGRLIILEITASKCRFSIEGTRIAGDFELEQAAGSKWTLRCA